MPQTRDAKGRWMQSVLAADTLTGDKVGDSGARRTGFRGERENDSGVKTNGDSGLKANSDSGGKANGFRSIPEWLSRSPE